MSDSDLDRITPVSLESESGRTRPTGGNAPPLGLDDPAVLAEQQRRQTILLTSILGALLLLAAGVFFLLPRFVGPPDLSTQPASQASSRPVTAPENSPFQEAQRMRQREAAQEILSELLSLQEALEQRSVERWAGSEFNDAMALAEQGDSVYREQAFGEAAQYYLDAYRVLQQLANNLPQTLERLLTEGRSALDQGDADSAREAFELALLLDPTSDDADIGVQRALVLGDVLALNEEAEALWQAGELNAARDRLREARSLDEAHVPTQTALRDLEATIVEERFRGHMTRGYSALQQDKGEEAETHFREALAVRPGSPEAEAALEQARSQVSSSRISRHLAEASDQERQEAWAEALAAYEKALDVDPNVVAAVEGRNRARSRLNLDNYLSALISDPLELQDQSVYDESVRVYTNALRVPAAGPRLREQLQQAKYYIEASRVPRQVSLRSDGQTQVSLLRQRSLGSFTEESLALPPGRYVATGVRERYRDVRVEFEVPFEGDIPTVEVISNELVRGAPR